MGKMTNYDNYVKKIQKFNTKREHIWEKGPIGNFCGTCLHKFDCRETTLSNAANHFELFLIEFEICLYINICTSCTLRIPYSQLLSLFPCYGNLTHLLPNVSICYS